MLVDRWTDRGCTGRPVRRHKREHRGRRSTRIKDSCCAVLRWGRCTEICARPSLSACACLSIPRKLRVLFCFPFSLRRSRVTLALSMHTRWRIHGAKGPRGGMVVSCDLDLPSYSTCRRRQCCCCRRCCCLFVTRVFFLIYALTRTAIHTRGCTRMYLLFRRVMLLTSFPAFAWCPSRPLGSCGPVMTSLLSCCWCVCVCVCRERGACVRHALQKRKAKKL